MNKDNFLISESDNFLSNKHKKIITQLIEEAKLPFFMGPAFGKKINYPYLCHTILKRPEDRTKTNSTYGSKYAMEKGFNSEYADIFLEFLFAFCDKQKVKINKIFRIAVNLTFNIGIERCPTHRDHDFNHKQLIIYLTNPDRNAKTVLLNKKNKIVNQITPKKYKGILFGACDHYMLYPKKGARMIVIYTFD
jgi:hypothetical protein|tara:strand:- start:20 stop:595 length:576 start_codon:yes stop_codon:yes gene_type:complete